MRNVKFLLLAIAVYLAAVTAYAVWSHADARTAILREIDKRLVIAARAVKYMLAPDFHDRAVRPGAIAAEENRRNSLALAKYARETGIVFLYTVMEKGDGACFTSSVVTGKNANGNYYMPFADESGTVKKAFRQTSPVFGIESDQWGTFRGVLIPEFSPGGNRYLAGADYEVVYVNGLLRQNLVESILTAFSFILISLPVIWFYMRIIRRHSEELKASNDELQADIAIRKQAQEALRQSEERYRTILDGIADGYYEVDTEGNLTFFNDSLCRILGSPKNEPANLAKFIDKKTAIRVWRTFNTVYKTGKTAKAFDWTLRRKDGSRCHLETSISLIKDSNGEITGFRGIARDVSVRKKYEEELSYLAYHDPLTGLHNRKYFLERLSDTLGHAKRYGQEGAVFYIDLDNFKAVNDVHGHETGDDVLRKVADRLRSCMRKTDYICRMGGDEFTVILTNPKDVDPQSVARKIIKNISAPYHVGRLRIDSITPSIGICLFPENGGDVNTLINRADQAMYTAKEEGNRYVVYDDGQGDVAPGKAEGKEIPKNKNQITNKSQ